LRAVGVEKALPGIKTFEDALKIYSEWSTPEEAEKWGFIAIYISIF
jgi:ASC-1-like (ASCH) protein